MRVAFVSGYARKEGGQTGQKPTLKNGPKRGSAENVRRRAEGAATGKDEGGALRMVYLGSWSVSRQQGVEPIPPPPPPPPDEKPQNEEDCKKAAKDFFELLNKERKSLGRDELKWDNSLTEMGEIRADALDGPGSLDHGKGMKASENYFKDNNMKEIKVYENLGSNFNGIGLFNSQKASPGHYQNMIYKDHNYVGVGARYFEKTYPSINYTQRTCIFSIVFSIKKPTAR